MVAWVFSIGLWSCFIQVLGFVDQAFVGRDIHIEHHRLVNIILSVPHILLRMTQIRHWVREEDSCTEERLLDTKNL